MPGQAGNRSPNSDPNNLGGPPQEYGLAIDGTLYYGTEDEVNKRYEAIDWVAQNPKESLVGAAVGLSQGILSVDEDINMAMTGSINSFAANSPNPMRPKMGAKWYKKSGWQTTMEHNMSRHGYGSNSSASSIFRPFMDERNVRNHVLDTVGSVKPTDGTGGAKVFMKDFGYTIGTNGTKPTSILRVITVNGNIDTAYPF